MGLLDYFGSGRLFRLHNYRNFCVFYRSDWEFRLESNFRIALKVIAFLCLRCCRSWFLDIRLGYWCTTTHIKCNSHIQSLAPILFSFLSRSVCLSVSLSVSCIGHFSLPIHFFFISCTIYETFLLLHSFFHLVIIILKSFIKLFYPSTYIVAL